MNISQLRNFHTQLYYYERLKDFSEVYQEEKGYLSAIGLIRWTSISSIGIELRLKDDETWKDELYAEMKKRTDIKDNRYMNDLLDEVIDEELEEVCNTLNHRHNSKLNLALSSNEICVEFSHPLIYACFDESGYTESYQLLEKLKTYDEAGYYIFFSLINELIERGDLNDALVNESFISESDKIKWETYERGAVSEFEESYRIYEDIKQELHDVVIKNAVELHEIRSGYK